MTQDEGFAHPGFHPGQCPVDGFEDLDGLEDLLRRRRLIEVGSAAFKLLAKRQLQAQAPAIVDQQAPGHSGQEGPGFTRGDVRAGRQQANEGVLRQVRSVVRTLHAAAQPAEQPSMIATVQGFKRRRLGCGGGLHEKI
ncbi:hypothetical protein D3C81_1749400 [compost metagenome]